MSVECRHCGNKAHDTTCPKWTGRRDTVNGYQTDYDAVNDHGTKPQRAPKRKRPITETFDRTAIEEALKAYYGLPEETTFHYQVTDVSSDPRHTVTGFKDVSATYLLEA